MESDAEFLALAPEAFVRFYPFGPFNEKTEWRLNKKPTVKAAGQARTGFVFQRADTRPQWLLLTVDADAETVQVDDVLLGSESNRRTIDDKPVIETTAIDLEALDNE